MVMQMWGKIQWLGILESMQGRGVARIHEEADAEGQETSDEVEEVVWREKREMKGPPAWQTS